MLAFKGDYLEGHTILGEGESIDGSNRHVILRLITELRNKLNGATLKSEEAEPSSETAQGSQGNQGHLRVEASTHLKTPQRVRHHPLAQASQNILPNEVTLTQQLD